MNKSFISALAFWIRATPEIKKAEPVDPPCSANTDEWEQYEGVVERVVFSALASSKIAGWLDSCGNFEPTFQPWMQCEMDSCGDQDLWKPVVRLDCIGRCDA